jgi:predicted nucleic acid-binding protein
MDKYIFVDAWAWLALSNRKDMHHEIAKEEYGKIKAAGYRMITSDYVIDELITSLFRNVDFSGAIEFMEQELAINNVFTGDIHFEQVNLGFKIIPK